MSNFGRSGNSDSGGVDLATSQAADEVHSHDDVDASARSHHHTLGKGNTQAYPGNKGEDLEVRATNLEGRATSLEASRTTDEANITTLQAQEANTGGATAAFVGPWPAAAPGPTTGTAITLPAGKVRAFVSCTCYTTVAGAVRVDEYLDGVLAGSATLANTNAALNNHTALPSIVFERTITAGTHYLYLRQITGTSDGNDISSWLLVVTPT